MGIVKIKDKTFKTSIPEAEILKKVQVVADRINKDFEGKKPVFLAVLNVCVMCHVMCVERGVRCVEGLEGCMQCVEVFVGSGESPGGARV